LRLADFLDFKMMSSVVDEVCRAAGTVTTRLLVFSFQLQLQATSHERKKTATP
jgi:hypothetical protein